MIYEKLLSDKDNIIKEIGTKPVWESNDGKHMICSFRHYENVRDIKNREEIKSFLRDEINLFMNTFRPRLENISRELIISPRLPLLNVRNTPVLFFCW
jgi:hypothetical protein